MKARVIVGLAWLLAVTLAQASNAPALASFQEQRLYPLSLVSLPQREAKPTLDQVQQLIADRLLTQAVLRRYGIATLYPAQTVAYTRQQMIEHALTQQLYQLHKQKIDGDLGPTPAQSLLRWSKAEWRLQQSQLEQLVRTGQSLLLEYRLNPTQVASAQKLTVLSYQLGTRHHQLSLAQLYQQLNVQGRVELFQANLPYLQQQAHRVLFAAYVNEVARQHWSDAELDDLKRTLAAHIDMQAVYELFGLPEHTDRPSAILQKLQRQVSHAEIAAYYRTHREKFKTVAQVKARHIQIRDEKMLSQLLQDLQHTRDFASLAQRYSSAPDAKQGGDLGWLKASAEADWLTQFALMQTPGQVSAAVLSPSASGQARFWEIVWVEQKQERYASLASSGVQEQIRQTLARAKAERHLQQWRQQILQQTKINWLLEPDSWPQFDVSVGTRAPQ